MSDYQPPVSKLLSYGEDRLRADWPDYVKELSLKPDHIPDLICMATDPELDTDQTDKQAIWAPVHAWRALGQLGATEAVVPLFSLFEDAIDEWANEELPVVMGMIGASALPKIKAYLADSTPGLSAHISAMSSLKQIAQQHPDQRSHCIEALTDLLKRGADNEPDFNGFLIWELCDLKAIEVADVIEQAFQLKQVDLSIMGDWDEAQVKLGFKRRKDVPRRRFSTTEVLGPMPPELLKLLKPEPQGFATTINKSKKKKAKSKKKKR